MLSKEEIEKAKERINKKLENEEALEKTSSYSEIVDEIINDNKAIKTLLQYIDQLEQENKTLKHTNKSYKGIINKLNKIISEMVDSFFKLYQQIPGTMHKFFENGKLCKYGYDKENNECKEINCKPCIKQYFEKKVEGK